MIIPASLIAVSFLGLTALFSIKIYELKHRVRFFANVRARIDGAIEACIHIAMDRLAMTQSVLTPVRVALALFGGIAWVLAVAVMFLEYVRAHLDRMTRYVALHYGDTQTTQSMFLKEIASHKKTVTRTRRPRRTQVDNLD